MEGEQGLTLFVYTPIGGQTPIDDLLSLEPERNLLLCSLHAVGPVADVTAHIDGIVPADGARLRIERVSLSEHAAALLDNILAFPHHGENWSTGDELDETREERLCLEVTIVDVEEVLRRLHEFASSHLITTLFEAFHDVADQSPCDPVGLHHYESTLGILGSRHRVEKC